VAACRQTAAFSKKLTDAALGRGAAAKFFKIRFGRGGELAGLAAPVMS